MKQSRSATHNLGLMQFIDASPTAAHAVQHAKQILDAAGFRQLDEGEAWNLKPGERFYIIRQHNSLVAGRIGKQSARESGFRLIGAHTDSPGFRLKPHAQYSDKGYLMLGLEVYGGPLLATWTDRDLSIAGKIFVRQDGDSPKVLLVRADRPLCRIPQAAIHFNREVNDKGLVLNRQRHLPAVFGLGDDEALRNESLLVYFAEQAGVDVNDIVATDFELFDSQAASLGGLQNELLFAPRIDNLAGSHAALSSLLEANAADSDVPELSQVLALFDSEEIGSQSLGGAGSRFLDSVLERLATQDGGREDLHRALARSVMVSVDGAHATHPNYAEFHDPRHPIYLNAGPVIKVNAMQRYATTALTQQWFERCAAQAGMPVQHYVHRADLPCGSTIGPMTSTRLGVPTVDVGNPMLAMHSIRETGGAEDQGMMIASLVEHLNSEPI